MFLSFCGKVPRDEGAAFVAPNATVHDLTLQGKYFLSLANYFVDRVAGNLIGEGLPHAG